MLLAGQGTGPKAKHQLLAESIDSENPGKQGVVMKTEDWLLREDIAHSFVTTRQCNLSGDKAK